MGGDWAEVWDARLEKTGCAKDAGNSSGGASSAETVAAGPLFYAVRSAVKDEVVKVPASSSPPNPNGEQRGPFSSEAEAEAALAQMMMDDIVDAFDTDEDACNAAEATPAGVGSATPAAQVAVAQRLSVTLEAASRHTIHAQATDGDMHSTARLNSLLGQCPETQLSAASIDARPTFALDSHSRVVRWLRAQPAVDHVVDIPEETVRALHCLNGRWKEVPQEEVDGRMNQMASFAPRLAKQLLPYQRVGVTAAIRFCGRMLLCASHHSVPARAQLPWRQGFCSLSYAD
jgi:hypothetical protein